MKIIIVVNINEPIISRENQINNITIDDSRNDTYFTKRNINIILRIEFISSIINYFLQDDSLKIIYLIYHYIIQSLYAPTTEININIIKLTKKLNNIFITLIKYNEIIIYQIK